MRLEPQVNTHPRLLREASLLRESAVKAKLAKAEGQLPAVADGLGGTAPTRTCKEPGAILTAPTRTQGPSGAPNKAKPTGSRFLDPVHLSERQKLDIGRSLKKKGIGDEMGRQIFIAAVEYQLSAFADQLVQREAPQIEHPPRDRALDQILLAVEEQARLLAELLLQVPKPSRSSLARAIAEQEKKGCLDGAADLDELGDRIDRLRRACNQMTSSGEVQTQPAGPEPKANLELVRKLAGAFAECFEQVPTAAEDGAFRTCLAVLDEATDLAIGYEPDFLSRVLGNKAAG